MNNKQKQEGIYPIGESLEERKRRLGLGAGFDASRHPEGNQTIEESEEEESQVHTSTQEEMREVEQAGGRPAVPAGMGSSSPEEMLQRPLEEKDRPAALNEMIDVITDKANIPTSKLGSFMERVLKNASDYAENNKG